MPRFLERSPKDLETLKGFCADWDYSDYLKTLKWVEKPANYIILSEIEGEWASLALVQRVFDKAELIYVYTCPRFRRTGVAKGLMDWYFNETKIKVLTLEVESANAAALALYKSLGCKKIGMRKNYYSNGSDATIMAYKKDAPSMALE